MTELKETVRQLASTIHPELIAIRRHLHAHPELSFEEFQTAGYIEAQLRAAGITNIQRKATTGVIALIEGKNPGKKTIALRADIDALPIKEANNVPYCSKNEGVMHACGHDVHTTGLLGAARILHQLKDQWEGTIKLIFQPGEEKIPGGASLLIGEGVLRQPEVSHIFGQHVMPLLPAGTVGFRSGLYMASADEIYITIKGKGGHGAMPHMNTDPIVIAAQVILGLQQVVSRNANATIPSVLSVGKVIAQGATNIIPNEVYLEGTFRTLDEPWRAQAHEKIRQIVTGITSAFGATCDVEIRKGYPFLKNDPGLTENAKAAAIEFLGEENVKDLDIWMAAEDFAYYSQEIPACFYRLGVRNEARGITSSVHTPTFDIDEEALTIASGLMAWLAIRELDNL